MARPTVYSDDLAQKILEAVAEGDDAQEAAAAAGIHKATLYRWITRGEAEPLARGDEPFETFAQLYRAAERQYARRLRAELRADPKGWARIAWLIEKRWPDRYGRRTAIEHSGPGGGPIHVDDARGKLLALLARGDEPGAESADDSGAERG